jgi:acyl-CoA synthetase
MGEHLPGRTLAAADPRLAAEYVAGGWWGDETLGQVVARHAATVPESIALINERGDRMSWQTYDNDADLIARALVATGLARGARVAVLLPDSPLLHSGFVGAERAGLVVVGIGHRAGPAEVRYLVEKAGAQAIVTTDDQRDIVAVPHRLVLNGTSGSLRVDGVEPKEIPSDHEPIGPSEFFLLNSTSGTTGLPKCVMQTENRWVYFHQKAVEFGRLTSDDVFMSVVPGPSGFGLWTAHFTPALLGAPCVVMERFSAEGMIDLIEAEHVTVLACVSTQFIMALNSPRLDERDLSSLRVMFTGGEAIPYERALEFEDRVGATLLNFYGSNETGLLSGTRLDDDRYHRLTTAGRCVPEMHVQLFDEAGHLLPEDAVHGVPGCKGPATSLGYFEDDEANRRLFTHDGWMLLGDVVEINDGWLSVVGRTSDFIIRGGKNISAAAVEAEVGTHPAVRLASVVPAPDPVFGERVACYVEVQPGTDLTLEDLKAHLLARGVSKEWFPEHLFVVAELPRSTGSKVAKGDLKRDAASRVAQRERPKTA